MDRKRSNPSFNQPGDPYTLWFAGTGCNRADPLEINNRRRDCMRRFFQRWGKVDRVFLSFSSWGKVAFANPEDADCALREALQHPDNDGLIHVVRRSVAPIERRAVSMEMPAHRLDERRREEAASEVHPTGFEDVARARFRSISPHGRDSLRSKRESEPRNQRQDSEMGNPTVAGARTQASQQQHFDAQQWGNDRAALSSHHRSMALSGPGAHGAARKPNVNPVVSHHLDEPGIGPAPTKPGLGSLVIVRTAPRDRCAREYWTGSEISRRFGKFGTVQGVDTPLWGNGEAKEFFSVHFSAPEEAARAISRMSNCEFAGGRIICELAGSESHALFAESASTQHRTASPASFTTRKYAPHFYRKTDLGRPYHGEGPRRSAESSEHLPESRKRSRPRSPPVQSSASGTPGRRMQESYRQRGVHVHHTSSSRGREHPTRSIGDQGDTEPPEVINDRGWSFALSDTNKMPCPTFERYHRGERGQASPEDRGRMLRSPEAKRRRRYSDSDSGFGDATGSPPDAVPLPSDARASMRNNLHQGKQHRGGRPDVILPRECSRGRSAQDQGGEGSRLQSYSYCHSENGRSRPYVEEHQGGGLHDRDDRSREQQRAWTPFEERDGALEGPSATPPSRLRADEGYRRAPLYPMVGRRDRASSPRSEYAEDERQLSQPVDNNRRDSGAQARSSRRSHSLGRPRGKRDDKEVHREGPGTPNSTASLSGPEQSGRVGLELRGDNLDRVAAPHIPWNLAVSPMHSPVAMGCTTGPEAAHRDGSSSPRPHGHRSAPKGNRLDCDRQDARAPSQAPMEVLPSWEDSNGSPARGKTISRSLASNLESSKYCVRLERLPGDAKVNKMSLMRFQKLRGGQDGDLVGIDYIQNSSTAMIWYRTRDAACNAARSLQNRKIDDSYPVDIFGPG